jgi:hypothetical protein
LTVRDLSYHNFKSLFFFTCSLAAPILEFPEEASMTDEKKRAHCGSVGCDTVGMSDAIASVTCLFAVLVILMLLVTSIDGVAVFLSGIAVGGIAGILLWSLGTGRRNLAVRRVGGNSRTRFRH